MNMSDLYKKTSWTNPNIIYLFNSTIYEYDIKSAGLSISKFFNLLPEETIEKLEAMPKHKRVVAEGKLQIKDKEYRDALSNGFAEMRKLFIESNAIEDNEIISIKKDAIFISRKPRFTNFKCVKFTRKNSYSCYINAGGIEYYYSDDALDIKGIGDENIKLHEDGILAFIINFFDKMQHQSKKYVLRYVTNQYSLYKQHKLPVEYYREFNASSKYRVLNNENELWDDWWDERKDELNIQYNIDNVFIPFTKIAI